eukprot:s21_g21.t1
MTLFGISPELQALIRTDDLDVSGFGLLALSLADFDKTLASYSADLGRELTRKETASLRKLWQKCAAPETSTATQQVTAGPQGENSASWSEAFPPKVPVDTLKEMKLAFESAYPSEILDANNMPGPRLLALTSSQLTKKDWKWAFAIALCRGAHLHVLKQYVVKFVRIATTKFDGDSSLRSPNTHEMMLADQQVWTKIAELHSLRGWSLDDAIHELTEVRSDLDALLQPRPAARLSPSTAGKGKTKGGKGKGKSKQSSSGKGNVNRTPWATELIKDGKKLTLHSLGSRESPLELRQNPLPAAEMLEVSPPVPSHQGLSLPDVEASFTVMPPSPEAQRLGSAIPSGKFCLDLSAGSHQPIGAALRALGMSVLSVDISTSQNHALLNDQSFERILRVAASGQVAYMCAAPNQAEFVMRQMTEPGRRPVRTPEFPQGIPNPTPAESQRLACSDTLLTRCLQCLLATHASGGHGHLEQLKDALSWQHPLALQWVSQHAPCLAIVPACKHGLNVVIAWLFASSFQPFLRLGATCDHPHGHTTIATCEASLTAEYPQTLAKAIADIISPVLSPGANLSMDEALAMIPVKAFDSPPSAQVDGAGTCSQPDWSRPCSPNNLFHAVRQEWIHHILVKGLHKQLVQRLQHPSSDPPFSDEDVAFFKALFEAHFGPQHHPMNWDVPADQPFCLHALHQVSHAMTDTDTALFPSLLRGVPTGYHGDIPRSHVFALNPTSQDSLETQLSVHLVNWKSAEDHDDLTSALLQEELAQGHAGVSPAR